MKTKNKHKSDNNNTNVSQILFQKKTKLETGYAR